MDSEAHWVVVRMLAPEKDAVGVDKARTVIEFSGYVRYRPDLDALQVDVPGRPTALYSMNMIVAARGVPQGLHARGRALALHYALHGEG